MRLLIATMALIALAVPAVARDPEGVVHLTSAPASLTPDKAYLLFTSSQAKSGMMKITHVFMRVPTEAELAAYRVAKQRAYEEELPRLTRRAKGGPVPTIDEFQFAWDGPDNVFAVDMGDSLGESDTYLLEVPPGTYVLYGIAVGTAGLATCNCLGTVKFDAAAGTLTQMGGLFADKVHRESPVPHLEDNLGPQMFQYGFIMGQALVPAEEGAPLPAGLAAFPHVRADYRPVGMFRERGAASINRLAPIPGILEYDRGRVVLRDD
jgi:hypothetical protein